MKAKQSTSIIILFVGFAISMVGLFIDLQQGRVSIHEFNQYESSSFQNGITVDPIKPPDPETIISVPSPTYSFNVNVPNAQQRIKLEFRYQCSSGCPQTWLKLNSHPGPIIPTFLIHHPVFERLDWFAIRNQSLFLYQKELKYKSVAEFLSDLPSSTILTEQNIQFALKLNSPNIQLLEQTSTIGDAEYILSSYYIPRQVHGWSTYASIINLEDVPRGPDGNIVFTLNTPEGGDTLKISTPTVEAY